MKRPSVFTRSVSTRPAITTSLLLAFALAASACGTGSEESIEAAGESGDENAAAEYESPLGDFLGWTTDFNNEDNQAKYQEIERKAQEITAACMRAEGFEYTPVDYSEFEEYYAEEEGDLEWGSKAWTKKYGFGISTQMYSQEEVGPDLVGHNYPTFEGEGEEEGPVDPNQAYVESLPEAEQEVYYETLYGKDDGPEYDPALSDEENDAMMEEYYNENFEPSGCMNEAYQEASGQDNEDSYQAFEEQFGEQLENLYDNFESDPRVIEYRAKVTSCVAEKGFEYTDEDSVYEDIEGRMESFTGGQFDDPFEGMDPETMSEEEIDAVLSQMNSISDEDKIKLAEVQEYELGLAAAVSECSGGFVYSYQDPELTKIRVEMEQEFLDNNADTLKEFEGTMGG